MDVEVVSGEKWEKDPDRGNAVLGVSGGKMEESGVSWDLIRRSQLEQREWEVGTTEKQGLYLNNLKM